MDRFFNQDITEWLNEIETSKKLSEFVKCEEEVIEIHDALLALINDFHEKVNTNKLESKYYRVIRQDLVQIKANLRIYPKINLEKLSLADEEWVLKTQKDIQRNARDSYSDFQKLYFNYSFFVKAGFFLQNIVAVGANGSGKTSLAAVFKNHLWNSGLVISAQRMLFIPEYENIKTPRKSAAKLRNSQVSNKRYRNEKEFEDLKDEFNIVLQHLLSDSLLKSENFRQATIKAIKHNLELPKPEVTNLDKTLLIWNDIIKHRNLLCDSTLNIVAETKDGKKYPVLELSDGEKVILYLIAHVIQAPRDSFIVIDEPEMYLHKTVQKKLWDILESERNDCIFIYLTHDLSFATSRTNAKKLWIKSFDPPYDWQIEEIPKNEIPESLLLELLGSQNDILFCEGKEDGIDEKLYSILFRDFIIIPVGGCFEVISYTKAFNKLPNNPISAYGLVDRDYHDEDRIQKMIADDIFTIQVAEIENLFLDLEFLELCTKRFLVEGDTIENIKADVLNKLDVEKEIQISRFVNARIDYYLKDSHLSSSKNIEELESNYSGFTKRVNILGWYNKRETEIKRIIEEGDYESTIRVFNDKGLRSIIAKNLKISNFTNRALLFLRENDEAKAFLMKYFPVSLKDVSSRVGKGNFPPNLSQNRT